MASRADHVSMLQLLDHVSMLQFISRCMSLSRSPTQYTSFWILDDNPFHYLTFFLCFIPLDSTTKFSCLFLHCPFLRHKMFWSYNLILIVMIKWNRLQEHNGVAGETVPRETVFPRIWTPSKSISSRPPVCQTGKPEPGVQRVNITPNFFLISTW